MKKHLPIDLVCVAGSEYKFASLLVMQIMNKLFDFEKSYFFTSGKPSKSDNYWFHCEEIEIYEISSKNCYSNFLLNEMKKYCKFESDAKHILVFQWDGFIIKPDNWNEEFLNYDYIGAPWNPQEIKQKESHDKVGNGGFSLRSKKLVDFLFDNRFDLNSYLNQVKKKWIKIYGTEYNNEDILISVIYKDILEKEGFVFAPLELAKKFSAESYPFNGSQFGFHGINNNIIYLPKETQYLLIKLMEIIKGLDRPNENI